MDAFPELAEDTDWEGESAASTVVGDDDDEQERFGDNDYGVPYNDENIPPASPDSYDVPWAGDDPAELDAANLYGMATELGLTNRGGFMRFARDDRVFSIVSWLVQQDFGDQVDLVNFAGWQLARRVFLVGRHNATEMLGLTYTARQPDGRDFTAAAVSSAFEQMENRRRELGIQGWGSMSLKWRVCYGVLQLYLGAGPDMAYDLATREAYGEGNGTEANMERMEAAGGAVRAYAEMMREEGEYDPILAEN